MKVLQLITDRDRRGAQVFALDLESGLRRLGLIVETVALAPGTHGDMLGVRALGARRLGFRTMRELRIAARGCDVVVAHGSSTLPASALGLVGIRVPVIYRQISDPNFWAASWSRRLRVAIFLRRMSAVIALSADVAAVLKRHYWLRERPSITVIPNAVPAERFRKPTPEERLESRARFGLPIDSNVILFIGALAPEKGADLAIAATGASEGAMLLVAGEGPQRDELEEIASRTIPQRCVFVGPLDDARPAYWAADLLVFPSRGGDSMPAVLIEAGLCGLASVATDVGAIGDVIEHGTTGIVVPPDRGDAISTAVSDLLSDPDRRLKMGTAAMDRCLERFTIECTAPAWLDLFSIVCRPSAGRGR